MGKFCWLICVIGKKLSIIKEYARQSPNVCKTPIGLRSGNRPVVDVLRAAAVALDHITHSS